MDHGTHLAALRAETARFAEVASGADPDRPVPGCAWSMGDLTRHLGGVHRWAASAVRDGRPADPPPGPAGSVALHRWYVESAGELLDVLEEAGPDRPCWTLAPPRTAGFWCRRQAQETLVHRWDAEASQGSPGALDPLLCVDGIDEVVTVLAPRQVRLGRAAPLTGTVELHAGGHTWVVGDGRPRASLTAPPDRLLLLLWGRLGAGDPAVVVGGEREVVDRLLAGRLVP